MSADLASLYDDERDAVADALRAVLQSPNVSDSNGEPANVVDALAQIAWAIHELADAVKEQGARKAAAPVATGDGPIARFNAQVGVSTVMQREWNTPAAPGAQLRCPLDGGRFRIADDDRRAWCDDGCELAGTRRGIDAYGLWSEARRRGR